MIKKTFSPIEEARLLAQVYEYLLNRARLRKLHSQRMQTDGMVENAPKAILLTESSITPITVKEEVIR